MRICFVAYHAFPLFDPDAGAPIGGAETHAWLLAQGLARSERFDVHFVVQTAHSFRQRRINNITVWNVGSVLDQIRRSASQRIDVLDQFPWLHVRQWHPSLLYEVPILTMSRLFQGRQHEPGEPHPIYSSIAPDVICCFGVSGHAATAIASARQGGATSILFLESNSDLDERFTKDSIYVSAYGESGRICYQALTSADVIIAQTPAQQELLKDRWDRDSELLPNAIDLKSWDNRRHSESPTLQQRGISESFVLWIGRADRFHKRPALCLELARQCPDIPFVMILNPGDEIVEREIRDNAPGNVTLIPRVPFEEMPSVISRATAYVSTGSPEYEGNPNVFLQAATSGVPVLSLEVNSPLLEESQCGFVSGGDLNSLAQSLRQVWDNEDMRQRLGNNGRSYVEQHCDLRTIAAALEQIIHRFR